MHSMFLLCSLQHLFYKIFLLDSHKGIVLAAIEGGNGDMEHGHGNLSPANREKRNVSSHRIPCRFAKWLP